MYLLWALNEVIQPFINWPSSSVYMFDFEQVNTGSDVLII